MNTRPYVLSIAGFDPSSGAGVTSDIKTFEQHEVYGLSVVTAITFQNESSFKGVKWLSFEEIEQQLITLAEKYTPTAIKVGLIESASTLKQILDWIKKYWPEAFIIWDPILKASAGFPFHSKLHLSISNLVQGHIHLLTPNLPEYHQLFGDDKPQQIVDALQSNILIKGGHQTGDDVCDELYMPNSDKAFRIKSQKVKGDWQKHGTGCILSSAIAAEIALNNQLPTACSKAHYYVKKIIGSNSSLLGYHTINS
ncbi:hydroxymethylpyrimidine/phosphomethylpyrimidine kinase [Carboxylicivirga marina]|uniref:hydroxymethylpyrimidine kinase n=1 Tax=Carboxylicivirga marina TaxID=2800988 RepID=A0ABS1HN09_9BACT|nr:hydroxymethylpyrimidine/phosphomethylpyrimidine kinase [Carboxylicivirga marina]MBK3518850.1 hydroxymethylpyrimidine/phosphomethylpyrimidine kinase [Carboxylicivirga marina]